MLRRTFGRVSIETLAQDLLRRAKERFPRSEITSPFEAAYFLDDNESGTDLDDSEYSRSIEDEFWLGLFHFKARRLDKIDWVVNFARGHLEFGVLQNYDSYFSGETPVLDAETVSDLKPSIQGLYYCVRSWQHLSSNREAADKDRIMGIRMLEKAGLSDSKRPINILTGIRVRKHIFSLDFAQAIAVSEKYNYTLALTQGLFAVLAVGRYEEILSDSLLADDKDKKSEMAHYIRACTLVATGEHGQALDLVQKQISFTTPTSENIWAACLASLLIARQGNKLLPWLILRWAENEAYDIHDQAYITMTKASAMLLLTPSKALEAFELLNGEITDNFSYNEKAVASIFSSSFLKDFYSESRCLAWSAYALYLMENLQDAKQILYALEVRGSAVGAPLFVKMDLEMMNAEEWRDFVLSTAPELLISNTIRLNTLDTPTLYVNNELRLRSTVGEASAIYFLAYLIDNGGSAPIKNIALALYPEVSSLDKAYAKIRQDVKLIRKRLPEIIFCEKQRGRRTISTNFKLEWDVDLAKQGGTATDKVFLPYLSSEWAEEIRSSLRNTDISSLN